MQLTRYEPDRDLQKYDESLHKTTWCSMPWTHQFIDAQGKVKPCCRFLMPNTGEKNLFDLNQSDLKDIFFHEFMDTIRSKMLENKQVKGCLRCYEEEASGKKSLRERYNEHSDLHPNHLISSLKHPKIRWIELAVSNDCNLACRMCDSRYSTKWFNDEKDFYGKTFSITKKTKWDIHKITPFLKNIVHIKFTGGEPLMINDHLTVLDKLMELKDTHNIFLNYSTNLTIKPTAGLIKRWKKFKHIEIACSFDGIEDTWELVRYPGKWTKAEKVIRYFFQLTHELNCRIILRSTISVNNILGMPESFKWWTENWDRYAAVPVNKIKYINPTHLSFPGFLSTTVLPEKYKIIVANKLIKQSQEFSGKMKSGMESQVNYMLSADHSAHLKELKGYTLHFDKKRGQNFFKVNPELKGLFDNV